MRLFSCPDSGRAPLWREGGEYNTRKGNKPALNLSYARSQGFYPPAASGVVESSNGGASNASVRAFAMTNATPTPEDRLAAIAAAIAGADRAEAAFQSIIRVTDGMGRLDVSIALLMHTDEIKAGIDALRRCRDVLEAPCDVALEPRHSPHRGASDGENDQ